MGAVVSKALDCCGAGVIEHMLALAAERGLHASWAACQTRVVAEL